MEHGFFHHCHLILIAEINCALAQQKWTKSEKGSAEVDPLLIELVSRSSGCQKQQTGKMLRVLFEVVRIT